MNSQSVLNNINLRGYIYKIDKYIANLGKQYLNNVDYGIGCNINLSIYKELRLIKKVIYNYCLTVEDENVLVDRLVNLLNIK